MVNKAKDLAEDLLVVVREEHAKAKAAMEQWQQQQQYVNNYGSQFAGSYSQVLSLVLFSPARAV